MRFVKACLSYLLCSAAAAAQLPQRSSPELLPPISSGARTTAQLQPAQQSYPQQNYPQQTGYPQQNYPQQTGYPQQNYPQQTGYPPNTYPNTNWTQSRPRFQERTGLEIGVLYGTSFAYGVGMGIWLSSELKIDDPGVYLIAPALLGLAGPTAVYVLDQSKFQLGMPSAISAGMAIGAAEGLGIAGYQMTTASDANAWGFRELTRSMAIGSTLGAVGGYALGYFQEPAPETSLFLSSGVVFGTAIGGMLGYGATRSGLTFGEANDGAALGGLIGLNAGLAVTAALSTITVPSYDALGFMWIGGGIGAAISLPVYLLYTGDNSPPAKRGLLFTATATSIGIGAGWLYSAVSGNAEARGPKHSQFATLDYLSPVLSVHMTGVQAGGTF